MLDKMKDNTVFLESVTYNSSNQKARIKGTIIEVSKQPRQVMLALFPNVKNLSELEDMNLSMVDLPLHSCQREAVLLGEHSKSEVKLTNHLDQLHRDLINSMEKQIEDRTTELATANQELEDANNQLARQSARQLEHFACMSHEIRTPLNCIVGMSSLLLEDCEETEMDPMHEDSIRMIHTSGELLKAVVDDVLDYAKLESGAFLVDIKPTRLQDALDSVVHSISQKVQEKNIRLRTHYSPTLPEMVETDSRRLQQVLFNLLGNAGKFSKEGSVIDLSVKLVHLDEHDAAAKCAGSLDLIRFCVKDYGKGIDSKDFEKIFKPFSQASKETQNVYGGTGLGLSITSKLVKRLGGRISVNSELDKFAEFTVDLPMNPELLVDVKEVSRHLENATIVLVDPIRNYDYSFTSSILEGEPDPLSDEVSKVYGLNVLRCTSLEQAYKHFGRETVLPEQHFVLLVHETLYNDDLDEKLNLLVGKGRYTVLTHGPNYMVHSTKKRHFKSLSGIFPVTLLSTIANHITLFEEEQDGADMPSNGSGLCATLSPKPTKHANNQSTAMSSNLAMSPSTSIRSDSGEEFLKPLSEAKKVPKKYDLKVLYAEDNLVNQKVLSRVLNRAGITDITIVDNGKKAVDLCAMTHFDCIFMDMQMPVMDGMEATRIIIERDPNAKVIFVTAHALDEFKHRADSIGATSFISKPFRVSDIEAVLEKTGIHLASVGVTGNKTIDDAYSGPVGVVETTSITSPPPFSSPSSVKPLLKALGDNKPTPKAVKPLFDALGGSNKKLQEKVKPLFESLQEQDDDDVEAHSLPPVVTAKRASTGGISLFPTTVPPTTLPESGDTIPGPPLESPSMSRTPPRSQSFRLTPNSSFKTRKEATPTRSLKVLYAEDNLINQKVLSRVLNRTGIDDVTIVDNGKKAVDITENTKFDVIFMDYEMPIMDGMEATKHIMEKDPDSKVIFVTAHALEEYKKKAFALGATSFLSKPVKAADIEAVLQKLGM
jgi:signal transduction histidine kinase/PleD family two-component response regulator